MYVVHADLNHIYLQTASTTVSSEHLSFWATVCKTVRPMLSVHCLSCMSVPFVLSVTFVHCGQTVGRVSR